MSVQMENDNGFRLKGWHVLSMFIAFFGVIIVVNVFMATLASSTWTGLIVKNSYVASQTFNAELAAARAQQVAGWKSQLAYQDGRLSVSLTGKEGEPLMLNAARVTFGRPAFEQQDQTVDLVPVGQGQYAVDVNLASGEWFVQVTGTIDGKPYRRDAGLTTNHKFSGRIK
ncbi:FixH family protein [Pseudahrensia aquimaris]|uniref:FixH family protein n=1 Tax=Pseudahrensia aquimaris TaxID=744461 RepID=A0ABW3FGZ2_9HYPH